MRLGTCKHFTSSIDEVCDAGVKYRDAKLQDGSLCCFDPASGKCSHRAEPTAEDIAAFDRESEQWFEKQKAQMQKLEPMLDRIREKYRGRDMHGHATCPICGVKGSLTIQHSKRKGHIHAFCTTEGCVRMME